MGHLRAAPSTVSAQTSTLDVPLGIAPKVAAAKDTETARLLDLIEVDSPYFALQGVKASEMVCLISSPVSGVLFRRVRHVREWDFDSSRMSG